MWLLAREIPGEINPWNGQEDSLLYHPNKKLSFPIRWWRMPYCGPFGSTNRAWYQPTSKVRCNPWCCEQRLVVQCYTNRPASFLNSSHLPYKLKSPPKRIPYSSTKITEDILMEISCHELDIEFLTPPNEHYRRIEDSRWKENRIEINNRTVGECKQLFLCFLWFIQCSSAIKLSFVVNVQMKAQ